MHMLRPIALALFLLLGTLPAGAATYWSADFETGIPPEVIAPGAAREGTQGFAPLGQPGRTFGSHFLRFSAQQIVDTRLVLRNLPPHDEVSLGFLLGLIDSWDGTELFEVTVQGQKLWSYWFQLATGDSSNYPAPPGALLSRNQSLGFSSGYYYDRERAYDLALEPAFQHIPHAADSLVITWSLGAVAGGAASQWQGGSDESYALDQLSVTLGVSGLAVGDGPAEGLALAVAGAQPARGGLLRVALSLPHAGDATLELFDAAGRQVARERLDAAAGGRHVRTLGHGRLASGLYWARLTQGAEARVARAVVLR